LEETEPAWIDKWSGPSGFPEGQKKPKKFWSLNAMNHWLLQPEQIKAYTGETDTKWFTDKFAFVGITLHLDTKERTHFTEGDMCQLFVTGGEVRCQDLWQAYHVKGSPMPGPEIGDQIGFMLRRYPYVDELKLATPMETDKSSQLNNWVIIPYVNKCNTKPAYAVNYACDGSSIGRSFPIGKVKQIYNAQDYPLAQMQTARKAIWQPRMDGSWGNESVKLRYLHIDTGLI